jgi:hypothetical protein
MRQYSFFIMRPVRSESTDPIWQVTHHQSGERTLASSATAATDWMVDRVGTANAGTDSDQQPMKPGDGRARAWAPGHASLIGVSQPTAQDAV